MSVRLGTIIAMTLMMVGVAGMQDSWAQSEQSTAIATLDGKSYTVTATGTAKVTSAAIDANKSVRITLNGQGEVEMKLPKNMIDGISSIKAGTQNIAFTTEESSASDTTIKFTVPSGASAVDIEGATVVPEFGILTVIVLATSLVAFIGIARLKGSSLGFMF